MKETMKWFKLWRQRISRKNRYSEYRLTKNKIIFYCSLFCFFSLLFGVLSLVIVFAWTAKDLPSSGKLIRKEGFATRIFDRNGEILFDLYKDAKRTPVRWEAIPDTLKWATIAVEDKEFYSHPGFSLRGIARAFYNIIVHHRLQGGSTLTQQLIKNVLLSPERTLTRKIKEFILALQTERKYSKDEILLMYLNEAPYGGTAWGVGAAAEQYFGKNVSELNLVESAILAGLPQRPSVYSPFSSTPKAYIDRTKTVLRRMREDGYIDFQQEKEALEELEKVKFASSQNIIKAPHFVIWIKKLLEEKYGEEIVEKGGLQVKTTLDLDLQEKVEQIVKSELEKVEDLNITNGAVLVLDPQTGQVLALIGSKDYFAEDIDGKFDVVTQGLRQPGSAIKPVTYALALEKGYTAATLIMDVKTVFPLGSGQPDYIPTNYDGKYHGPLPLRYALGNSINVPAVKVLAMVGLTNMLEKAYQMGISTLQPTPENLQKFGLSVTLGGGDVRIIELAAAYCAFANGGFKQSVTPFLQIATRDGKILEEYKPVRGKKVLTEEAAYIISDILADDKARLISFGERSGLYISGKKVAVKTGTTNDKRDNWAVGWTANVLVAVWVGNNNNSSMKKVASGISGATPIWRRTMIEAIEKYGYRELEKPANIVQVEVDNISGYPAHDGFPSRSELFIVGTEPRGSDPIHAKLKLCKGQNKLATPAQIARGDYEEKEFFIFKEEDPVSTDGKNRWQEGILNWVAQQSDFRYHPPESYCDESGLIVVSFQSPVSESTVNNDFLVKVEVTSVKPVKTIEILVNEEKIREFNQKPYEANLHLESGTYRLKAVVKDENNNQAETEIRIGVNLPWDWQPSPTPTPTSSLTPTPTITPSPSPTVTILPTPT